MKRKEQSILHLRTASTPHHVTVLAYVLLVLRVGECFRNARKPGMIWSYSWSTDVVQSHRFLAATLHNKLRYTQICMHLNWLYVYSIDSDVKAVIISLLHLASHWWLFKKLQSHNSKQKTFFFEKDIYSCVHFAVSGRSYIRDFSFHPAESQFSLAEKHYTISTATAFEGWGKI